MILSTAPVGSPLLILFLFHLLVLSTTAAFPNQAERDEVPFAVEGDIRLATDDEIEINTFYTKMSASFYSAKVTFQSEYNCDVCDPRIKIVQKFASPIYDVNAIILRSDSLGAIYIAFRGALSPQNNVMDLELDQVDYPYAEGAKVHRGFFNGYQSVRGELLKVLDEQISTSSDYKIVITGHSLGGAQGLLCALDLYNLGGPYNLDKLYLYAQGQPRVGNDIFARYVVSTNLRYYRVVNENDPVPHSPSQNSPTGIYVHAGEELWTHNDVTYVCSKGIETDKCSNTVTLVNFLDHLKYLGVTFTPRL
ncbi:Alpha/Beta hydrolase protein [Fennellomyces sp. T-0311]|nr:Alpha/Beta hydrolase protein [Fennellomyces sp. T-0311]